MAGTTAQLRALSHARLWARSGAGTETVLHALAHARIAEVSPAARKMLVAMESGALSADLLRDALRKVEKDPRARGLSILYGALLAEGGGADDRLARGEAELLELHEAESKSRARQVGAALKVVTAFFMATITVPLLAFGEARLKGSVPVPHIEPWTTYGLILTAFGLAVAFVAWRRPS